MARRRKTPGPEPTKEAAAWLDYALGDLATAVSNRKSPDVPSRNAGYMAQQAAEKAIKAVILLENKPFEMVHDVDVLAQRVPSDFVLPVSLEDFSWLSDIETMARYPDEGETVTSDDVDRAIDIARKTTDAARGHFVQRGVSGEEFSGR